MKLFVPGRICLFGEHSDWAGGYRRINADVEKGYAVITGTNQGIYAEAKAHPSKLVIHATAEDGRRCEPFEVAMESDALLAAAEDGGFYSYAAGVAYQIATNSRVRGLEIDNYRTDLPIKKGLSSSAAICVLVARAFNRIYDLKLTVRGEMELAYAGETTTPSRCGRLDQGCAYGNRPILMKFDADRIDVQEVSVPEDIHLVVVDLKAGKDTKEILSKLNKCYPFAETPLQETVQEYLGPINKRIVKQAVTALEAGDVEGLGKLMCEAQSEFDRCLEPACPSQLKAPVLHRLLNYEPIQPLICGGKGVGSQGDGSAQLIARDLESRDKIKEIIENDLGMACMDLTIRSSRGVRKAVIPAAGFGTRLFPATKAVKKELFPVIDHTGRAKPVILAIVEEALSAGIEEICILVQTDDLERFEEIFGLPPSIENFNKLSQEDQKYCEYLMEIGYRITFLPQDAQEGFGHAVYCARDWVGSDPFLLLLGDHLYHSSTPRSCAQQLIDTYRKVGTSVVGVQATPGKAVRRFGTVTGVFEKDPEQAGQPLLSITEFFEKPTREYAAEHLHVDGMEPDTFLTVFGQYVLKPQIFDYLEENIRNNVRERGEFQLTCCLEELRKEDGFIGQVVEGERFDIGNPEAYVKSLRAFRKAKPGK